MPTIYTITGLQTCEPEALEVDPSVQVIVDLDGSGFGESEISSASKSALLKYFFTHWGNSGDQEWDDAMVDGIVEYDGTVKGGVFTLDWKDADETDTELVALSTTTQEDDMTATTISPAAIVWDIVNPDGTVEFTAAAEDEIAALDAWADSMDMGRYSDQIRQEIIDSTDQSLVCRVDGVFYAIHCNYSVSVRPATSRDVVGPTSTSVDVTLTVSVSPSDRRTPNQIATEILEVLGDTDLSVDPYQEIVVADAAVTNVAASKSTDATFVQNPNGMFDLSEEGRFEVWSDRSLDEGAAILTVSTTGPVQTFAGFIFGGGEGYYVEVPQRLAGFIHDCIDVACDTEDLEGLGVDEDDLEAVREFQSALKRLAARAV